MDGWGPRKRRCRRRWRGWSAPGANIFETLAALLLLCAVVLGPALLAAGELASSRAEQARMDVDVVRAAAELYAIRNEGACPASVANLVEANLLSRSLRIEDPWNEAFEVRCREGSRPVAISRGPDRELGTADDIRSDRRSSTVVDPGRGFKSAGVVTIAAPFLLILAFSLACFVDRLATPKGKNLKLTRAFNLAKNMVGDVRLEGWHVTARYGWKKTTINFYRIPLDTLSGRVSQGVAVTEVVAETAGFTLELDRWCVTASRRGFHADVMTLAEVLRVATALPEGAAALELIAGAAASNSPYR